MSKEINVLERQIAFLRTLDKLKTVLRKTRPIGENRQENTAEHSWQAVLSAVVLKDYATTQVDILKVMKMLLVHDVVELEIGDMFHYEKNHEELYAKEHGAAKKIFSLLPDEQAAEFLGLWEEFEQRVTPEAQFSTSIDRLQAFLLNPKNDGGSWKEFGLSADVVLEKNRHIEQGSPMLWNYVKEIIEDSKTRGFLT